MQIFFVEQALKMASITAFFKKVEVDDDKIILNVDCNKATINKKIKLVKKTKKILQERNVDTIIVEEKLKQNEEFMNLLYSNNFKIIERKIFV